MRVPYIIDSHNIRVADIACRHPFTYQPLYGHFTAQPVASNQLQRNRLVRHHVFGLIDQAHPAASDHFFDDVAVGEYFACFQCLLLVARSGERRGIINRFQTAQSH